MIKNITVCMCDVRGKIAEAPCMHASKCDIEYTQPEGWSKGANTKVDMCPECTKKIKAMWRNEK